MFTKLVKTRNGKKGFTLIELMVVVGIIAVLSAVAIPAYLSYRKESQMEVARTSLVAIVDSMNGYNAVVGGFVDVVDDNGNIQGTIEDALDKLSTAGMNVTVDSIKFDAPLATYCYFDGKHFILRNDVDEDVWAELYDDGIAYNA